MWQTLNRVLLWCREDSELAGSRASLDKDDDDDDEFD